MRYWYAYTGEELILGHGRTIRRLMSDARTLQRLSDIVEKQTDTLHKRVPNVPKDILEAALMAPLAVRELGDDSSPAFLFSSAGQVLGLFEGLDTERLAVHLFNGKAASAYAAEGDISAIIARVVKGFSDGALLSLPRDAARLHTQEITDALPGVAAFLLARSAMSRKAFEHYIRRGTPPAISRSDIARIVKSRPVLRTWEREARLEQERHSHEKCC